MKKRQMYLVRRERYYDDDSTSVNVGIYEIKAAAIAYNKYYNCNVTMSQLVKIFADKKEFKTICIKEIYII